MNKVTVRAPVRADLAGGTLDLWPLYLFHPGSRTVNVAISHFAESEVTDSGDGAIEIHLTDQQYRQRYDSLQEMAADPKAALLHRILEHFKLSGISIVTRTDAPRGSGLGGSSALAVTLVRALSEIAQRPVEGEDLIFLVRDLETRLLGVPAGIQDYYPPVYGGLGSLHLIPGKPARHTISTPLQTLGAHMLLHYTGVAHFSGTNNWELYKRHLDGKKKVRHGLEKIASAALEMEHALEAGQFEQAGTALRSEWEARKAMIDGISTPEIEAAIDAATAAGAWAGKVCGAGGGGSIVFFLPPDRREAVIQALASVPGRLLDVVPVTHGLVVEREYDAAVRTSRPRPTARATVGDVEQLYVSGGTGSYRPFLLAEAIVTLSESRSGFHHSAAQSYAVPLSSTDGRVLWQQASLIQAEDLDLRAVPDSDRKTESPLSPQMLAQSVAQSHDAFRQFLVERTRVRIFHNPAFALYSEPSETRQAFLARCMEEATRRLEDKQERLESTYRRRIDQLRERSEREQREIDENESSSEAEKQEIGVAWGQTLYNITSGRRAPVAEPGGSIREGDYFENIAQIQRSWDRERLTLREELTSNAQSIEEISIAPTSKNVEITKFLLLWAGDLA
jgi:D-glycero-alpha-D-manno-heptose-7-phosphate kinase